MPAPAGRPVGRRTSRSPAYATIACFPFRCRPSVTFQELQAFAVRNPMLSLALAGLTVAIVATEIARLFRGYKTLKPAELVRLINREDAVVIDLSAAADFQKGHIAGSRNVAAGQFDPAAKQLAGKQAQPVVLVCRSGVASAGAARRLKKAGFTQVYALDGGIAAWQQADLPLVKGR